MRPFADVSLRAATAVVIVLGLLVVVTVVYFRDGYDLTAKMFTLLQGVLLGAFGWLYGSHGADRATRIAADAINGRRRVTMDAATAEAELERLERDVASTRRALLVALTVPGVQEKIDEDLGRAGGEAS